MSRAAAVAQRLLDGAPPMRIPRRAVAAVAELLKREADRQINVDSQRSLEIADLICRLASDGGVRALGLLTRADALRELGRYAETAPHYQEAGCLFPAL